MINQRLLDGVDMASQFGAEFSTRVVTLRSGAERRNANWSAPLGRYRVVYSALTPDQHAQVINAHRACLGRAESFRFRDWTDYRASGELLGIGMGAGQTLQLVRRYQFGVAELVRPIVLPVLGTVQVLADGDPVAATVSAAGVVTLTAPLGALVTWSGEFDVPVRFDDDRLDVEPRGRYGDGLILSTDVGLTEVRG